jgi:hypothetical protein
MRHVLTIAAALSVASCASVGVSHQETTRAMIYAEASFNAAVQAERQAKASHLLTPDQAARGDALVRQAYTALKVLRVAYAAGGQPSTLSLLAITAQIVALVSGPQP